MGVQPLEERSDRRNELIAQRIERQLDCNVHERLLFEDPSPHPLPKGARGQEV